jgi:hypothetical protein
MQNRIAGRNDTPDEKPILAVETKHGRPHKCVRGTQSNAAGQANESWPVSLLLTMKTGDHAVSFCGGLAVPANAMVMQR